MNDTVYLDWAATALPNTVENFKALKVAEEHYANPSAQHAAGKTARDCLEKAREKIALLVGVKPQQIFFTSGGTESNQIALMSNIAKPNFQNSSIAVSSVEHPAISEEVKSLKKIACTVLTIPCDENGFVSPPSVLQTIRDDTAFVSVMTTNNEVGTIEPVTEIVQSLRNTAKRTVHVHSDAVQALGKNIFNIGSLGVDSLSMSAHKLGGMRGIGFLYLKRPGEVFNKGGSQERGIRAGTENLAGILSLQYALEKYHAQFNENLEAAHKKMNYLITELSALPDIVLIPKIRGSETAEKKNFSPYILQLAHKKIAGAVMQRALSDAGIFVSTGSACSSTKLSRPILQAMRVPKNLQQNAFRVSLGNSTSKDDLKRFLRTLREVGKALS